MLVVDKLMKFQLIQVTVDGFKSTLSGDMFKMTVCKIVTDRMQQVIPLDFDTDAEADPSGVGVRESSASVAFYSRSVT